MIKRLLLFSVFIFSLLGCNNKAEDSIIYNVNKLDDISYLDQARENLQHNNYAIRYKTFQAMLECLN